METDSGRALQHNVFPNEDVCYFMLLYDLYLVLYF